MSAPKLNKLSIPTDRWSASVYSPVDIADGLDNGLDVDKYGKVVVLHPGWQKSPKRHAKLLIKLAENGYLPLGVDTRIGHSDRQSPRSGLRRHYMTSTNNPYFPEADRAGNRWKYRRPTVLLDSLDRLNVDKRFYVGHSMGGLICALASAADPSHTDGLIIVNGACMGDSSGGVARMMKSNGNTIKGILGGANDLGEATVSGLSSTAHTITRPRRFMAEKQLAQQVDAWEEVDKLEGLVDTTVMHARNDELIDFADTADSARLRPWVSFVPTEGGHDNVYQDAIHELIINTLAA